MPEVAVMMTKEIPSPAWAWARSGRCWPRASALKVRCANPKGGSARNIILGESLAQAGRAAMIIGDARRSAMARHD